MELPILIILLLIFWSSCWATRPADKREFELVKPRPGSAHSVSNAIFRGYQRVSRVTGKPFFVRYWQKDYLILPVKYLPDVRRANRDHLAFLDTISDTLFLYNWIAKLSDSMFQESLFAFEKEIGLGNGETKSFKALDVMTAITLRTMTRIIAGKGLSRNEDFLNATRAYFNGNFTTGYIMLKMPFRGILRDFLAWPLYKYHQYFRQQRLIDMIKPYAAKRMEDHRLGIHTNVEFDAIQCSLDRLKEFPFNDNAGDTPLHTLSHETLQLVWAGGQSPAMTTTTMLFKLLETPLYIDPLREEAQAAVEKHGWTDAIFNELPKIDSFIRETNRLYPTFSLKDVPFTFSDGLTIPPGTRIAFPAEACQQDPDLIVDPTKFDGFRFVRLAAADSRQEDGVNRWAASHTSYSNLANAMA
ncbi:hypothetical protein DL768_004886 [Monosporascus sp. mg162]|nr:hypothetical protein DL768_004886 [Monosporascus sp. mg162]